MSAPGSDAGHGGNQPDTAAVLEHHLAAFAAAGLDALLLDYGEASVVLSPDTVFRGKAQIRGLFKGVLESTTPEFWQAFEVRTKHIENEIAYITWAAPPFVQLVTDTMQIRNGIIEIHTFTSLAT